MLYWEFVFFKTIIPAIQRLKFFLLKHCIDEAHTDLRVQKDMHFLLASFLKQKITFCV